MCPKIYVEKIQKSKKISRQLVFYLVSVLSLLRNKPTSRLNHDNSEEIANEERGGHGWRDSPYLGNSEVGAGS